MIYADEEDHIISHLNAKFAEEAIVKNFDASKIEIVALPEVDEDFDKGFGKRKLFVAFAGEEAENQLTSLSAVSQEANALFSILIKSKTLRDAGTLPGVYSLVILLKKFLVGFEMLGGQPLVYMDTKMESRENGVFNYVATFRSKIQVIQDIEEAEEDLGGLLTQVNYHP